MVLVHPMMVYPTLVLLNDITIYQMHVNMLGSLSHKVE